MRIHKTGATSVRFSPLIKGIGNIPLPKFEDNYVFTKKQTKTSDTEYEKQIIEQARKDYKNGKFQNDSEGFNKLMKRYTQEVSPDRKGIITSGLNAVSRNSGLISQPIDVLATLLDGRVRLKKSPLPQHDYIEFYDKNGEMVATYSNNGWTMFTTKAEAARQTEMCIIYTKAWNAEKTGARTSYADILDQNTSPAFDVTA